MKTIKCVDRKNCKKCDLKEKELDEVVAALRSGELVVFPTDTLYGIGADPFNENSVKKVFIAKNRPFDMPLSIAVSNEKMMESVAVLNDNASIQHPRSYNELDRERVHVEFRFIHKALVNPWRRLQSIHILQRYHGQSDGMVYI